MEAIENETSGAVIESRTRPARGVMTRTALRDGETRRIVNRVIGLVIRGQVTAGIPAIVLLDRQRVIVVDVAGGAGSGRRRNVHAGQVESGHGVVKAAQIRPSDGVVALRAVCDRKHGLIAGMGWIIGLVIVGLVAELVSASGGRRREVVATSRSSMALRALYGGVCIREREACGVVIESGVRPSRGVVAGRALGHRESCCDVIRDVAAERLGTVPILEVAGRIPAIVLLDR